MKILAIDPGISGALAFYLKSPLHVSGLQLVCDMPLLDHDINPHQLHAIIREQRPDLAIIEQVHPHPKEGVSSVWRFAAAYTVACTVVRLLEIPLMLVTPARWKKAMGVKGGPEGKEQCRLLAIDMFPTSQDWFKLKKHHGRAEAALIAAYAASLPTTRNHERQVKL
jgi:Holliday junction resolvasome RuvABC endonuclease subunit